MKRKILNLMQRKFGGDYIIIIWAFCILIIFFVPLLWASQFVHPSADDYCFSYNARELGIFEAVYQRFISWTGRYSSVFFLSINPLVFDFYRGYQLIPFFLVLALISSSFLFFKAITGFASQRIIWTTLSFFFFAFFIQIPDLTQGIYWLSGSVIYMLPMVFISCFFYCALLYVRNPNFLLIIFCLLLIVLIVGSNESTLLMFNFILAISFAASIYFKRINALHFFMPMFLFSIICSLISILAPGNYIRMGGDPTGNLPSAFFMSFVASVRHILRWTPILGIVGLLVADFFRKSVNFNLLQDLQMIKPYVTFFLLIFGVAIGFFPSFYSLGVGPPSRNINAIYFLFTIGSFFWIIHLIIYLKWNACGKELMDLRIKNFLLIVLFCIFLAENPIRDIYKEALNGSLKSFHAEHNVRLENLKKAGSTTVLLPIKNKPSTLFNGDIDPSPDFWKNKCLALYFNKSKVYLKIDD